ncbi:MAG: hypothetical protein HQK92_03420 [Nitrospirae bacterium]|nr:hypothetical protein [Nitrospirota bacterium]
MVTKNSSLTIIGFIFFIIFFYMNFKKCIPLIPLIMLGIFSVLGSNRLVIFLAPVVGIGYGFFSFFIGNVLVAILEIKRDFIKETVIYFFSTFYCLILINYSVFYYMPSPIVSTKLFQTFLDIKKTLPPRSVIYSWWDYGYAIEDLTGFATFHDGGSQFSDKTPLIAYSFITGSQQQLYKIIASLTSGATIISDTYLYKQKIQETVFQNLTNRNLYIVITGDMLSNLNSFFVLAGMVRHNPINMHFIKYTNCYRESTSVLSCENWKIDLTHGTLIENNLINNFVLDKVFFIDKGETLRNIDYRSNSGIYLEVIMENSKISDVFSLDDIAFKSNLNQMFVLGRFNPDMFEKTLDASPNAVVYKVKTEIK